MSIDYNRYLRACQNAVVDESAFMNFKSNPDYTWVLEHVSAQQGKEYLDALSPLNSRLISMLDIFATNDNIGNPAKANYKFGGRTISISPTTLRYVKVLNDLIIIFGNLTDMDIVEIGSGYGGQCKVINDFCGFKSYTLIDLPEPLSLAGKYLDRNGVKNVRFYAPNNAVEARYDLCISNYAFTEIDRSYQVFYHENVINKSDRGYITCNFVGRPDGYSEKELLNMRDNSWRLEEKPLTSPTNFIYVWNLPHR